jgi:hypothetical protein
MSSPHHGDRAEVREYPWRAASPHGSLGPACSAIIACG